MPDFSKLARATSAPRPKALPPADYEARVKTYEYRGAPEGRQVDYESFVRIHFAFTGLWPDNITETDRMDSDGRPINLATRQIFRDFYDNALYRLSDTLASFGISWGTPGAEIEHLEEALEQLKGRTALVEVQNYTNQRTGEVGNQVGKVVGVAS